MNTKNLSESSESEIGPQAEFEAEIQLAIIQRQIILIRQEKVMLDSDLADLYGVSTKQLNQQVRRNLSRFPSDFMFQLSDMETGILRSQFVTSSGGTEKPIKSGQSLRSQFVTSKENEEKQGLSSRSQIVTLKRGENIKYLPLAFTEQGIAMLSSVLKSDRAIRVNIAIMRAFVRLRKLLAANGNLAEKIINLEQEYDHKLEAVFKILNNMENDPDPGENPDEDRPPMGFAVPKQPSPPIVP